MFDASRFTIAFAWLLSAVGPLSGQEELAPAIKRAQTFITVRQGERQLTSVPVLTTNNPSRGAGLDGSMLLWLSEGRPLAAMSVYAWDGKIQHECDSLSRASDFVAVSSSGKQWSPSQPGVQFKPLVAEAEMSTSSESARLFKLKNFAKQFEVTLLGFNDQNSDREQLRLLSTPVYRYQLAADRELHRDLIDGAVFAFVQGTDPEALLIIELVQQKKELRWEYALVRATAGALEGKWNGKVVFEAAKFPENTNKSLPHFTFSHNPEEIMR